MKILFGTHAGARALAILLASFLLAASAWAGTIKVGAILAVTGPASNLGAPEEKTARMVVAAINKAGGINGQQVELIIKDSAASSEKAVSFAKQLIEENQVCAIIGPTTSGESLAIKDLCQKSKVPLISCAASEAIVDPVAKYVFKTPQKDSYVAKWIFDTMKKNGITKIGVVVSNTGFGNGGKAQLEKYAPEFGITVAITEVYDASSTDLSALLTKVSGAGVQAIVNWSIEPAQSIVAKNMKQLNMAIPLYQSHGFGNINFVKAAGEAANGIIFPCGRLIVADDLAAGDPQKSLLVKYKSDYEAAYKEDVSTFGGHAYDALLILKTAIENAKSTDRTKIAEAIEKIQGLAGTAGIFNMSPTDHNGLAMDAVSMITVKNGEFVLYKGK
jgi:branched-chain amino acid transport system substrate-binding protein